MMKYAGGICSQFYRCLDKTFIELSFLRKNVKIGSFVKRTEIIFMEIKKKFFKEMLNENYLIIIIHH